ncbi:uncharacterized protein CLAFUR5_00556 [Fulvia fulva]|uniref:Uncharacterized protein n=1 Tax=Passalora fulva TaxID=5499 RepID=A0A9Q8P316_PASFU|nr:uncharacterized protein CLAFUR5_00556 [Fulvia fulva]KAK4638632.1 hypothetical protein CLAFUR0_00558 [Fulvia fulva]UJO11339.1 hypothetical protein CLAFUR5_00556 [Fulvia fulva]
MHQESDVVEMYKSLREGRLNAGTSTIVSRKQRAPTSHLLIFTFTTMLFKTFFALAFASLVLAQNDGDEEARRPDPTTTRSSSCRATTSTRRNNGTPTLYVTRCATTTATITRPRTTVTTTSVRTIRVTTTTRRPATTTTRTVTSIISRPVSTNTFTVTSTSTTTSTATPSASAFPGVYAVYGFEQDNCQASRRNDFQDANGELVLLLAPELIEDQETTSTCVRFSDIRVNSLLFQDYPDGLQLPDRCRLYAYQGVNCNTGSGQRTFDISLEAQAENTCRDNDITTVRSIRIVCRAD